MKFFEYAPKPPRPRAATLTKLRHTLPQDVQVALRAPVGALLSARGPLRPDPDQGELLAWTLQAAESLQARLVILPTPATLMPGARSRELLGTFVDALPRPHGRDYVWAPRGAWNPDEISELGTALGIVCAFDPLQSPRPPGDVVYAQLTAMGAQTGFSDATLVDVLGTIAAEAFSEAYVSFDAPRSYQHALKLQQVFQGDVGL